MRKLQILALIIGASLSISLMACTQGIHTWENNPNVVWIQGEACTVNMLPSMGLAEITHNMNLCLEKHSQFYPEN